MSISSFLDMNWPKLGLNVAPFLATLILSVAVGILAFRTWIAPNIQASLVEAQETITNLAKLAGVKKQDYWDETKLETVITKELLMDKMPELELLRLALSPSAWEQVEEIIETNPAAALKMYQKYAPLLGGAEQKREQFMF